MGQAPLSSIPLISPTFIPFTNLPKHIVSRIWKSYNLYGEGWAFTEDQVYSILNCIGVDDISYNSKINTTENLSKTFSTTEISDLFQTLDTDSNGFIDSLELLSILVLVSGN